MEIGKRYKVISDTNNFFQIGDIVISLEDDVVAYYVKEEQYNGNSLDTYICKGLAGALNSSEVELITENNKENNMSMLVECDKDMLNRINEWYRENNYVGSRYNVELSDGTRKTVFKCFKQNEIVKYCKLESLEHTIGSIMQAGYDVHTIKLKLNGMYRIEATLRLTEEENEELVPDEWE